jgi:chemotaxis protein CheD
MTTTTDFGSPAAAGQGARLVVGIGELAVSQSSDDVIVTHALGSCIAVCLWDPVVRVGGLLHFLLPEARLNMDRARRQPATFADTGIALLFQTAYTRGVDKKRCLVRLIGGAEVAGLQGVAALNVGKRNILMAREILWQNGVIVAGESTGGTIPRTVALRASDGAVEIRSGREMVTQL